ncbi:MAG: hypothetical protein H7Z76_16085 [Methylotenera sp.]|nr:hypothetical protein [Flavobacterium sp.]
MKIEKIKTKPWLERQSIHAYIPIGKKIIIYTSEQQELTIEEESKLKQF